MTVVSAASDVRPGDVVLLGDHRRRVVEVARCLSSPVELHLVFSNVPVPLCVQPSAVLTVERRVAA